MDEFFKSLFAKIKEKDAVLKIIIFNISVFLLISVVKVISKLFFLNAFDINSFVAVSSDILFFVRHAWTVFTYMFVHYDVLHILFNMLMLYWFGKIFLMYFTPKQFLALYILGGLAGALLYIVSFNTIPYFVAMGSNFMVGASASVTAIIFASAFYNKNLEVRLLFFGQVKIIYIAIVIFLIDFISLKGDNNLGGHIAHIGGAALGYLFASMFLKGIDITKWLNKLIDVCVNIFKSEPKMKVKYKRAESDFKSSQSSANNSEVIDQILDKIKVSGYKSLNESEKKKLFDASNK